MVFLSMLKLDLMLTCVLVLTVGTMREKQEGWERAIGVVMGATALGLLWSATSFYCVQRELRRGTRRSAKSGRIYICARAGTMVPFPLAPRSHIYT